MLVIRKFKCIHTFPFNVSVPLCFISSIDYLSMTALKHVIDGTKCHVLNMLDKKSEAQEILENINSVKNMSKADWGTLHACRSICCSMFTLAGSKETVKFMYLALQEYPDCALLNGVLGRNLRIIRRAESFVSKPSDEERNSLLKAYEISGNEVFGIDAAQMYRESREKAKAFKLYREVLHRGPRLPLTHLRLALGFIQLQNFLLANECLQLAAKSHTDQYSGMYLHYKGLYYKKTHQLEVRIIIHLHISVYVSLVQRENSLNDIICYVI